MSRHTVSCWRIVPGPIGQLYEGPRWIPEHDVFQWVDILGHAILRWYPYSDEPAERRELPLEFVTVALPTSPSLSIVASKNTLHSYDWETRTLEEIARLDQADDDIRFNDGGISPSGHVYVGTMSMAGRRHAGTLYRLSANGTVEPVLTGVTISNGLAWSSPTHAYYIDSAHPRIYSLNWKDGREGVPSQTVFVELDVNDEPDGLTVTPEGDLLVALWRGSAVRRFSAAGTHLEDHTIPATFPTSVALGGHSHDITLVTSARHVERGIMPRDGDGRVFYCTQH